MKKLLTLMVAGLFATTVVGCSQSQEKQADSQIQILQEETAKPLGIIGAMSEEVEILKDKMTIENEVEVAGMTFYEGTLYDKAIVLVRSGVGKVNMAACTQILVNQFDVKAVLNSGVSGTLDQELNQGDIVISTDAVQHDFDTTHVGGAIGEISRLDITFFEADQTMVDVATEAAKNVTDLVVKTGRVATGDQFVAGGEAVERIKENFGEVEAIEMEGAAMAQVAYLNEIPYLIIRSISDKADGGADLSYEEFLPLAAKNSSLFVEEFIKLYE